MENFPISINLSLLTAATRPPHPQPKDSGRESLGMNQIWTGREEIYPMSSHPHGIFTFASPFIPFHGDTEQTREWYTFCPVLMLTKPSVESEICTDRPRGQCACGMENVTGR